MNWSDLNITTVILDRDGVINRETGHFVKSVDEWKPIEGSLEAIATLTQKGYRIFVATNQSGITRGLYTRQTLEQIHQCMMSQVHEFGGDISGIYYCPHIDSDNCDCRKPKPGLLKQISQHHGVDLSTAVMVGDSIRDLQAGLSAGTYAVLISSDMDTIKQLTNELKSQFETVPVYSNLAEFVGDFLS